MAIKFSVIIPAYNAAATIVATLRSVLDQTLRPYEVIVVNDGSTDTTESLLLEHFIDRIIYIPLAANSGPAHARNVALAKATGTHIAFQDADDTWHLNKLEIIAYLFSREGGLRFIYHPYTLAPVDFIIPSIDSLKISTYSFSKLLLSNPIGTPCVVMAAHPGIRFNEAMHHMEDYDLFLQEAYHHGVSFLDLPLTKVNRPILSEGGQSDNRWLMRKGELRAYLRLPRLNVLFVLAIPFLILFGLFKHFAKSFRPPRSNY